MAQDLVKSGVELPALMTAGRRKSFKNTGAVHRKTGGRPGRRGQVLPREMMNKESTMTGEEKNLLKKYLTALNVLGPDGTHPHIEAWYQEVRYAQGPNAPKTVMEASEMRYKDILDAAKLMDQVKNHPGA